MSKKYTIMLGDCIDRMNYIEDHSVDLILADMPYGTTQCRWDTVIPFDLLWQHIWRVAKPNTGRYFIGIEKDEKYFNVAKARLEIG